MQERGQAREILEHLLHEHSLSIASFAQVTEIGSMEAIKQLVQAGLGLPCYQVAVRKNGSGDLRPLALAGWERAGSSTSSSSSISQHAQDYRTGFRFSRKATGRLFQGHAELTLITPKTEGGRFHGRSRNRSRSSRTVWPRWSFTRDL